jgi:hypothetical protein
VALGLYRRAARYADGASRKLIAELTPIIEADRPMSPRIRTLRAILAKLATSGSTAADIPGAKASRRAEPCAAQKTATVAGQLMEVL